MAEGLSGLEASITHVGTDPCPGGGCRSRGTGPSRSGTPASPACATGGLLDGEGLLTAGVGRCASAVEARTDDLAAGPAGAVGPARLARVEALATPLSRHVVDTEVVPVPNPIGAPRP